MRATSGLAGGLRTVSALFKDSFQLGAGRTPDFRRKKFLCSFQDAPYKHRCRPCWLPLTITAEEIKKCHLLCHNCHMEWTPEQATQADAQGLKTDRPKNPKLVRFKTGTTLRRKLTKSTVAQGYPSELGMIVQELIIL